MTKKRTNLYLTEWQLERLAFFSKQENLPQAELVRRALDAYLAWLDPEYQPETWPETSVNYSISVQSDGTGYRATIADMGITATGETVDQALENVQGALAKKLMTEKRGEQK